MLDKDRLDLICRYTLPALTIEAFELVDLGSFNGSFERFKGAFTAKAVLALEFNSMHVSSIQWLVITLYLIIVADGAQSDFSFFFFYLIT